MSNKGVSTADDQHGGAGQSGLVDPARLFWLTDAKTALQAGFRSATSFGFPLDSFTLTLALALTFTRTLTLAHEGTGKEARRL